MKIDKVALEMIRQANSLSSGTDNEEYVRGQAELISAFVDYDGEAGIQYLVIDKIATMITE